MIEKKKRHHYVQQGYLKEWASEAGTVFCMMDRNRVFPVGTTNVAVEKDFNRVGIYTVHDKRVAQWLLVEQCHESLRPAASEWLKVVFTPGHVAEEVTRRHPADPDVATIADAMLQNGHEDIHGRIEDLGAPFLDRLRNGDMTFIDDDDIDACFRFLFFIALQGRRTRSSQEDFRRAVDMLKDEHPQVATADFGRLFMAASFVWAGNIARSLAETRNALRIELLEAPNGRPFVTSDCPITNIAADGVTAPEHLVFFYPLSPASGLLLGDKGRPGRYRRPATSDEVDILNGHIANAAHAQVYANEEESLIRLRRQPSGPPV